MDTCHVQDLPQTYQRLSIDVERRHSGAAAEGEANDPREVVIPHEVVVPRLRARMKQSNRLARLWIYSVRLARLVPVTTRAGECEVVKSCRATQSMGLNMFDSERLCAEARLALAVFTAAICSFEDEAPKDQRDAPFSGQDSSPTSALAAAVQPLSGASGQEPARLQRAPHPPILPIRLTEATPGVLVQQSSRPQA